MALGDLNDRLAVLSAMEEFDQIGRAAFLERYGFGRSVSYFAIHNGRPYDSKAIVGSAHGHALGRPLTNDEFSGGEDTVAEKLRTLGFEVTRPRHLPWITPPGEETTRAQIMAAYGGGSQGGIEPSSTTPNVFVFTDPSESVKWGYNYDGWDEFEPGIFYITGDGQVGTQRFVGGNKSIAEAAESGRTLRLYETVDGKRRPGGKLQRYLGAFRLDPDHPSRLEPAPGSDGVMRDVIVFRLIAIGDTAGPEQSSSGQAPRPRRARTLAPENRTRDEYEIPPRDGATATRRESKLVDRFRAHLEALGSTVVRDEIPIPHEDGSLYTDLHDLTTKHLYEAKSSVDRATIRLGVGQILDYLRFLPETAGFLLLPSEPAPDLIDFVLSCGIGIVFAAGEGWSDYEPAQR